MAQRGPKPIELNVRELAWRYQELETLTDIAKATGISVATLRRRFYLAGIEVRPRGQIPGSPRARRITLHDHEETRRLRELGFTLKEIGACFGITRQAVWSRLHYRGRRHGK